MLTEFLLELIRRPCLEQDRHVHMPSTPIY